MELRVDGQKAIINYLRQIRFKKKALGGVDEEDVLDKVEHVAKMYTDLIEGLQGQIESLQQDRLQFENERTELIVRVRREAEKIITQAKVQAEALADQKEREIDRNLAGRRAEIEQLTKRRRDMEAEMDTLVIQMKTTMRLIAGDLGQMLKLTSGLDSKMDYRRTGNDAGGV